MDPDKTFRYPWITFNIRYFERWLEKKSLTHKQMIGDYCQGLILYHLKIKIVYDRLDKEYHLFYFVSQRINSWDLSTKGCYRIGKIFKKRSELIVKINQIIEGNKPRTRLFKYEYATYPEWENLKKIGIGTTKSVKINMNSIELIISDKLDYDLSDLENIKDVGPLLYNVGSYSLESKNYIMIN